VGAIGAAVALLGAGCAGHASGGEATQRLGVTLRDFVVTTASATVGTGLVDLEVVNDGPTTHELIIDRTDLAPGELPVGRDGLTVDETSPALHRVAALPWVRLGQHRSVTVRLAPGRYVLYCNLAGHYLGAMRAALEVVARDASQ
jgi:hypothetical protein